MSSVLFPPEAHFFCLTRQISSGLVRSRLSAPVLVCRRAWVALCLSRIVLDCRDKVRSVFIQPLTQRLHFDTSISLEQSLERWPANLKAERSWPTIRWIILEFAYLSLRVCSSLSELQKFCMRLMSLLESHFRHPTLWSFHIKQSCLWRTVVSDSALKNIIFAQSFFW